MMSSGEQFPCYLVRKDADGKVSARIESITTSDLPPGDVLIRVAYSSLNYKDGLATQGHPGVVRTLPHVPGVDCSGTVVESQSSAFQPGDEVLVTGYDFGAGHWGGFAAYARVPTEWIVPLPSCFTLRDAMIYGTAGFTAAQCVTAIVERGIEPTNGPVVVTGATGGVGCLAVAILAKFGYEVEAVTGKPEQHDWLRHLGATKFLSRGDVLDNSSRPLLSARWAAAVDTVGGQPLATVLRSLHHRGCVAACGLVAGTDLNTTIYPFILRGATLAGIDSAKCPRRERLEMWEKLSGPWHISQLNDIADEITLDELTDRAAKILAGKVVGRVIIAPRTKE
jgi:putative YhdH/YhfP family quinone oxidoreductase